MKENWSFEIYLKIEVSKIIWKLGFWKLNLRIGILEIIWQLEFWELNLRIRMLEIKFWKKLELFEDWSFENYIKELELWKLNLKEIRILKIIWELELWKLNYENWNLGNYLKMEFFFKK